MKTSETPEKRPRKTGSRSGLANVPSSKKKTEGKTEKLARQLKTTLAKLDIDPVVLAQAPRITPILENAQGGIPSVINAMRFSSDASIQAFLKTYDEASITDKKILPFEAFALMADVEIPQLLGATILAVANQSASIVKIMLPTHHPDVVAAGIKQALKPGGYRDRNSINTAMKLLPVKAGTTIMIGDQGRLSVESEVVDPNDVDTEDLFPNLEETQKMLEG